MNKKIKIELVKCKCKNGCIKCNYKKFTKVVREKSEQNIN